MFAIFQLNPAPFCLLDEVDAPLDDANTERYAKLVTEMAKATQFLFISHNQIAMEMAEQLIGVTMQEQGVSRIVTVDMPARDRPRRGGLTVAGGAPMNSLTRRAGVARRRRPRRRIAHGAWQARRAGPKRAAPATREEPSASAPRDATSRRSSATTPTPATTAPAPAPRAALEARCRCSSTR